MALHLTEEGIQTIPAISYEDLQPDLQSGDLIFCSGDYFTSKMIQKATASPWSHVGIVVQVHQIDRFLLLESVEDIGVRLAPLSKYFSDYQDGKPYDGEIVLARVADLTIDEATQAFQFGADALTKPYDKEEIIKILYRIVVGKGKELEDTGYICSELVEACFTQAGIRFKYDPRGFISPEDIWIDSRVEPLGRIAF